MTGNQPEGLGWATFRHSETASESSYRVLCVMRYSVTGVPARGRGWVLYRDKLGRVETGGGVDAAPRVRRAAGGPLLGVSSPERDRGSDPATHVGVTGWGYFFGFGSRVGQITKRVGMAGPLEKNSSFRIGLPSKLRT